MKIETSSRLWTVLGLGAALTTVALGNPAAAAAEETAPALSALTERDESGKTKSYPAGPGEVVPAVLGVANLSTAPIKGAVVNIRVINGLDLPRTFDNCHYYVYSNLDGAWCQLDEELAVGGTYSLADFRVAVDSKAEKADAIIFRWVTPEQAAKDGGIEALAKRDSLTNESTAGTQGTLRLEPRQLPLPAQPHPLGFAYIKVVLPPTTTPTTAPSTSPATTAPTAGGDGAATPSATPVPTDGGEGGGLPVTGAGTTTVAGIGAALLIAGGAGYLVARRRRTRFVA